MTHQSDVLTIRRFVFEWLGFYSSKNFAPPNYATVSYDHLQEDVYLALKKLLGKSIMASTLLNQVTTKTTHCAYAAYTGTPNDDEDED
jgi:hypothetical protein